MKNGDAKKSENLEVRVSYETKRKLSARAKSEDRTVSDVVRQLIGAYLEDSISKTHNSKLGYAIMFIKSLFTQKPKTAIVVMGALLMSPLSIHFSATAEDLILNIEGEHVQPVDTDGVRTRKFETQIELETGTMLTLGLDGQLISTDMHNTTEGFGIRLKINDIETVDDKKTVSMSILLFESKDGEERVLSEPVLKAVYGETAEFNMVSDFYHETGGVFAEGQVQKVSLKLTPQTKT